MKKQCFLFLLYALFCCTVKYGFSQKPQPIYKHYTVDDGLPSSEVYHVIQDSKGYMWFATDRGVSRFNGYEFENFSTEDGLSDNTVFGIHPDHKGKLWFRSFSGKLSYFYNDSIYSLPINDELQEKIKSKINISLYVDQSDTVWMGFTLSGGICKIAPDNSFKFSLEDSSEAYNYIKQIDKHGFIFGYMGSKPYKEKKINVTTLRKSFSISLSNNYRSDTHQNCIKLKNGSFIYSLYGEIICFDDTSLISRTITDKKIISIYEDREENLWVGFFRGGVLLYPKGNLFNTLPIKYLKGLSISSICEDEEGALWFTTLENGVYYLASKEFQSYTVENGLADNKVTCITGDASDGIWAGLYNGNLNYINNNNIQTYNLNESDGLNNSVVCLMNHSNGKIWIGTIEGTLTINTLTSNKKLSPRLFPGAKSLCESGDDGIWVGKSGALFKYENNNLVYNSTNQGFISRVSAIYEDDEGTVWLAGIDGLWSYDGNIFENHGNKNALLKNRVTDIKRAEDGLMWLATRGAGILIKDGDNISQVTTREGLVSNICNSLFIDKGNNVWVSTNNGLSKITMQNSTEKGCLRHEYKIENYTTTDGLISNEVNQVYRQEDKVWVATNKGITVFNAEKVKTNTTPPPVYITGLRINNNDTVIQTQYELPYYKNYLIINYVGLSYKNAGNLQYRYKMEGVDSNWIYTNNTKIQYTTLPHGNYQFTVSAINEDGVWSNQPATVSFFISPPFWHTWWFRILAVFTLISVVWLFFYSRYKRLRAKHEMEKSVVELKAKALHAQMNPHFIFNSLNSIQSYISANDSGKAERYLAKFAKLVRLILDNSRKTNIPLDLEIKTLQYYLEFEKARFKDKFDFSIRVDPVIDPDFILIPPMLIQPYVENSIIHGFAKKEKGGTINIGFNLTDSVILCTIEDNGIGREMAARLKKQQKNASPAGRQEHVSVGMQITKERLKMMSLPVEANTGVDIIDLKDDRGNSKGTKIEVFIPFIEK